ncbi:MAG: hypothetical protein Q9160_007142 [Pyrenula sp. 1 TL-2023]
MSIVADRIRRLDTQIDNFQLATTRSVSASGLGLAAEPSDTLTSDVGSSFKAIARSLETTSSRPLLKKRRLQSLLVQVEDAESSQSRSEDEEDLKWLIIAKAAVQTYGLILTALFEQTVPITDEIWYWEDVLGSYHGTAIYALQTSPLRILDQAKDVYNDATERYSSWANGEAEVNIERASESISRRWRRFYTLVRESVHERSLAQARMRVLSPFALCRTEARQKQAGLRRLRELSTSALGLLVDEGFSFGQVDFDSMSNKESESPPLQNQEWRGTVAKSIALMESVLRNVTTLEVPTNDFEDNVFTAVEDDSSIMALTPEGNSPSDSDSDSATDLLVHKLITILDVHLPFQTQASSSLLSTYGRPSRFIRYWIPSTLLLLSGSTLLRIITSHQAEITTWAKELGTTCLDFWANWVISPVKKLIGTIRHDSSSEVAIMSRDSLRADRESLERMVVDFAVDHPSNGSSSSSSLTSPELAEIRAKVKEGDLTPVLRAYEHDLQKPFVGTLRGDLIRALLIQIQKTKVDVEVAISGIDSLLKSQELVFGFVGLTPGLLITFSLATYLRNLLGRRKYRLGGRRKGDCLRLLRNIDDILDSAVPTQNAMLSYRDHGMLLCEVQVLRQKAVIPEPQARDFAVDVAKLCDVGIGVERQRCVLKRIRWAYKTWLR